MTQQTQAVTVAAPTLPKGGGALRGMGETLGEAGMTGQAGMSVPLPVSAGRGYAPSLSLAYSSDRGNSAFGLGWQVPLLTISRDTRHGAPRYDEPDAFLAPNGEVLIPERDDRNQLISRSVSAYGTLTLDQTYSVTRYLPTVMQDFERIERWQGHSSGECFWLIHSVDGQLHCLGKHAAARIADPMAAHARIGHWLLEESVSPTGEHICYQYAAEDITNVDLDGPEASRLHTANRYLTEVRYGNRQGYAPLYAWGDPKAAAPEWLFSLVFDYGRRTLDAYTVPGRDPDVPWPCRADAFSDYSLGFEVRTHRLCHQVLMFHHFPDELNEPSTLVRRLLLTYDQTPYVSQLITAQTLTYERDGTMLSMPPLELTYTAFAPELSADGYRPLPAFAGWNDGRPYQLVDLYGEGLPGVLGPYQEVGAMLTQLSNTLYLTKEKTVQHSMANLRAYQQVALSQGINDSGLFQLDFNDERYLPFEGSGVESSWKLEFPGWSNTDGNAAKTLLDSLDDVIIQVRYTATS
ncbi:SpvB/TcaC N-terminal domain-containing protein [Burkholderia stabilis]|uniref:SpvB/TcaC N-terminal domain-containing protein n=1 Tax=Burkholderia stabilis TaxID=95485 RepID=UPI0013E93CA0|nr:SpvB/TcaC N-terminal domain-containing protein [Burkholderia stabilis]